MHQREEEREKLCLRETLARGLGPGTQQTLAGSACTRSA